MDNQAAKKIGSREFFAAYSRPDFTSKPVSPDRRTPMAQDINKHLERARRSLEKNKLREAVTEYQFVLDEAPSNSEALQALADIYTRLNEPAVAAQYYGVQFDRLVEGGDGAKASAIFLRFLRPFPQPVATIRLLRGL